MKKLLPQCRSRARVPGAVHLALALVLLAVSTSSAALSQRVNLSMRDATFYQLFDEIRKQTGLHFVYNTDLPGMRGSVNVSAQNREVSEVIAEVLGGTGLTFEVEQGVVMVKAQQSPQAPVRQRAVTGTVVGPGGEPLSGVSVMVPGTTSGVTTDMRGNFAIIMPLDAEPMLEFSFMGMITRQLHVSGPGPHRVQLQEAVQQSEAVIVTGYQEIDKRKLTSAVTSLKMADIAIPGVNSIDKMLEGNVPGMIYMQSTGRWVRHPSCGCAAPRRFWARRSLCGWWTASSCRKR